MLILDAQKPFRAQTLCLKKLDSILVVDPCVNFRKQLRCIEPPDSYIAPWSLDRTLAVRHASTTAVTKTIKAMRIMEPLNQKRAQNGGDPGDNSSPW